MNLLVEQLKKQASDHYWSLDDGVRSAVAFENKLVELIVQECVAQCGPVPGVKFSPNSQSAREDCANKIKERFGMNT